MSYYGPDPYERPHARPSPGTLLWLVFLATVVVGLLVWHYWPAHNAPLHDPNAVPRAIAPAGPLRPEEEARVALYEKAKKSVVSIRTASAVKDPLSGDEEEVPGGAGSGFIWDENGHVVTNFHVIQDAAQATVTLDDGSDYGARLVGSAPDSDLVVLKIDAPKDKLQPIPVGVSKDLRVGQSAYAIGNPFRYRQTFTDGVVSALQRQIRSATGRVITGAIQTSAAINPGNSGGPLLDSSGRLIGVNTAIYSPSGANAGIGFAIPVDTVNQVVPELIRRGKIDRPGLGIHLASPQVARQLGVRSGVLVWRVLPGGSAAKAGVRPTRLTGNTVEQLGDVIVALDQQPISTADDLFQQLQGHRVGDEVTLTVLRDGERRDVPVKLQSIS